MEWELKILEMAIIIRESISMGCQKDSENIFGQMVAITKEISNRV